MLYDQNRVLLRGGGDLATGVAYRLHHSGFPVIVTELPHPLVVRRRVALALESPAVAMEIRVGGGELQVGPVHEVHEPDLAVRATLGGILSQLPFLRRDNAAPVGRMRISGDADLARRLQTLAERFDPDWQQPFVRVFGEIVGVQVANAFAAGLRHAREAAGAFAGNAAEYVTEESRDVVPREELNAFHDDVDTLRDDVERLAARIGRLHARAGGAA